MNELLYEYDFQLSIKYFSKVSLIIKFCYQTLPIISPQHFIIADVVCDNGVFNTTCKNSKKVGLIHTFRIFYFFRELMIDTSAIKTKAQKLKHHTGKNFSERNWISWEEDMILRFDNWASEALMIGGKRVSLHQKSDCRIPRGFKRLGGCLDERGGSYR